MKFTSAIGLLFLASGLVRAEKLDQCQELKDYLEYKVQPQFTCENNEEGKIKNVSIRDFKMTEEDFAKVQSYDTITDFDYYFTDYGKPENNPRMITEYNYLTNLKNLKNLERLNIKYSVANNPCTTNCLVYYLGTVAPGTFKDLKTVKELSVFGIKLSQENIDEIATMDNLESLSLDYCSFENVKDFSSLSHLKKVTYLSSTQGLNGFGNGSSTVPSEFVNQFKDVKSLTVDRCEGINYKQHPNIQYLKINEEDTSFLKDYKNLKYLNTLPTNDLSVLEYVDSLEYLEIVYEPKSYGYASFPYKESNFKFTENSHITNLNLFGVRMTNELMAEILKLKRLNNVRFDYVDFTDLSDEYFEELKGFTNRCPMRVIYYNSQFQNGYDHLGSFNNEDCDNITSVINEPTTTTSTEQETIYYSKDVEDPEPEPTNTEIDEFDPEPTDYPTEIDYPEPEPTDYPTEIDYPEPEPTNTEIDEFDPEPTDYPTEIDYPEPEPTNTEIDEFDPEPTDYPTEIGLPEPEPTDAVVDGQGSNEIPKPVVFKNPEQKYIEQTDSEGEAKVVESSPAKKSRKRKCYVKNNY